VESSGNVVVDFGKFCTGFLVVMGIGMSTFHGNIFYIGARYVEDNEILTS
jgi:hypothetical protein